MIISKRHLDNFRPGDVIPEGYYDDKHLSRHIERGRVVVVGDKAKTVETDYENMTMPQLRKLVDEAGLDVSKRSKKAMIEALSNGNR